MHPTKKVATTDLLEIGYEQCGDDGAPTVMLLHGFPDDVRTWDAVVAPLVAAGYRTLTPYLRGFGSTRFRSAATPRSGELAALGQDVLEFAAALGIDRYLLVGHDWGARAAYNAAILDPQHISAIVTISVGYGTNAPGQNLELTQIQSYWYQWYFNIEAGRNRLVTDRTAFCRYLWRVWSPRLELDDATFAATARSWENPDFVPIAIHSYRHRWGNAPSDDRYTSIDQYLATLPAITVPTTVLHGDEDGATGLATSLAKERFFASDYRHEVVPGVGHFIQRERPSVVVDAILDRAATLGR
ncbi:MAG: alpha/beta hydrolase [Herpetosiphon sp.]